MSFGTKFQTTEGVNLISVSEPISMLVPRSNNAVINLGTIHLWTGTCTWKSVLFRNSSFILYNEIIVVNYNGTRSRPNRPQEFIQAF